MSTTGRRQKDWADDEAERLYDLVRSGTNDDEVIDQIGRALRHAVKYEHDMMMTGPVGDEE